MDYFRAVRHLGIGCTLIAHVTKGESGDQRPFGRPSGTTARDAPGIEARLDFAGRQHTASGGLSSQEQPRAPGPPVGLKVQFEDGRVFFSTVDATTIDGVVDKCRSGSVFRQWSAPVRRPWRDCLRIELRQLSPSTAWSDAIKICSPRSPAVTAFTESCCSNGDGHEPDKLSRQARTCPDDNIPPLGAVRPFVRRLLSLRDTAQFAGW